MNALGKGTTTAVDMFQMLICLWQVTPFDKSIVLNRTDEKYILPLFLSKSVLDTKFPHSLSLKKWNWKEKIHNLITKLKAISGPGCWDLGRTTISVNSAGTEANYT